MSEVAIVTDSISCLPLELVEQYHIKIVPVGLVIDRKSYQDTDISNEDFWRLFYQAKEPVTTNAVNPADFEKVFNNLAQNTDSIVCTLVSQKLSATYNMACQAKETLKQKIPSLQIEIIDSKTAAGSEGLIVLETARAARSGKNISQVVESGQNMVPRVKYFCAMNTLKYIIRSGRAPKTAVIGDWLKVKPIIGMVNESGLVEDLGRERGMDKAISRMTEMIGEYTDVNKPLHIIVHYTDNKAIGEKLKDVLTSRYKCIEAYLTPFTPVMASQTGPVVGIAFYS